MIKRAATFWFQHYIAKILLAKYCHQHFGSMKHVAKMNGKNGGVKNFESRVMYRRNDLLHWARIAVVHSLVGHSHQRAYSLMIPPL